jgi:hypothetical protein
MATGNQVKAVIPAPKAGEGTEGETRAPEPRQYTVADLERARDRVAAAERRIENERSHNPERAARA